eukprot:tig00000204_g17721.t1
MCRLGIRTGYVPLVPASARPIRGTGTERASPRNRRIPRAEPQPGPGGRWSAPGNEIALVLDLSNIAYTLIQQAAEAAAQLGGRGDVDGPAAAAEAGGRSLYFLVNISGSEYDLLDAHVERYFRRLRAAGLRAHCFLDPAKGQTEHMLGTDPGALRAAICTSLEDDAELLLAFSDLAFLRRCLAVQALFVFRALAAARGLAFRGRRFLEAEAERKRKAEFEAALKKEEAEYAEAKQAAEAAGLPAPPLPPCIAQVAEEKGALEKILAEGGEPPPPPPPRVDPDELEPFRVAVVGGGDTARHLLDIALRSGYLASEQIQVAARRPETLIKYAKMNVLVTDDLARAVAGTQCVVLACGPRHLPAAAAVLGALLRPGLPLLSAVAGVPTSKLRATFAGHQRAPRAIKLQFRHDQPRELIVPEACRAYRPPEFPLPPDEMTGYINTASVDLSVDFASVYDIVLAVQEFVAALCPGLSPANARRCAFAAGLGVEFDEPLFERELSDDELYFKLVSGAQETVRAPTVPVPDAILAKEAAPDEEEEEDADARPREPSGADLAAVSAFRAYFARLLLPKPPPPPTPPAPASAEEAGTPPASARRPSTAASGPGRPGTARPATALSAASGRPAVTPRHAHTAR